MKIIIEIGEPPDAAACLRAFAEAFERLETAREVTLAGNGAVEASQLRPGKPAQPKKIRKSEVEQAELPFAAPKEPRERLHHLAIKNGVPWLRPLLEKHGAERLSALSDTAVTEILSGTQ